MNVILFSVWWQFVPVYLDGIVIFSKTPELHFEHVQRVPLLLNNVETNLKLKKWNFFTDNINYLDHVIRSIRLELASH